MATSEVDIANIALTQVGAATINAFTESSPEAKNANILYPASRDTVLRMHPWNSAIKRVKLSPVTGGTPPFDFENSFNLPADCLRVLGVAQAEDLTDVCHKVEGRTIVTDEGTIYLKYIHRVTDVSLMDALLVEAIAHHLAWKLTVPLLENANKTQQAYGLFTQVMRQAKSVDAKEDSVTQLEADVWTGARTDYGFIPLRQDR